MIDSFTSIVPLFFMMTLGFILGRTPICGEGSGAAKSLSTYVWWVAIPALLIKLIAAKSLPGGAEMQLVGTYYGALYIIYFLAIFLLAPMMKLAKNSRAMFAYTCTYGNLGFMGIPLIQGLYGAEGLRLLVMIISFHSMTIMTVSIVLTEILSGSETSPLKTARAAFISTIKNPVVLGLIGSTAWSATGLGLNATVYQMVDLPASSAAPVGLFAVGLTLSRVKLSGVAFGALPAVSMKMLLMPLLVYVATAHLLEFPPLWVGVATITAAMPTGVLAYTMAAEFDLGAERAASTVFMSTVFSLFWLTALIEWL